MTVLPPSPGWACIPSRQGTECVRRHECVLVARGKSQVLAKGSRGRKVSIKGMPHCSGLSLLSDFSGHDANQVLSEQ